MSGQGLRARDADGLCALFCAEQWPGGRAPFDMRFEPDPLGGWRWSVELWVPLDEVVLTGSSSLGALWWCSGSDRDAGLAMRAALDAGAGLEAERDGALYASPGAWERTRARIVLLPDGAGFVTAEEAADGIPL